MKMQFYVKIDLKTIAVNIYKFMTDVFETTLSVLLGVGSTESRFSHVLSTAVSTIIHVRSDI